MKSEYEKWCELISCYEKILHPDIFMPLRTQLSKVYEECKKDAYKAAKISDDALWLDERIKQMKEFEKGHSNISGLRSFSRKNLFKDILNRFS